MDLSEPIQRIHESHDPASAFEAMVDWLSGRVPLRAARWRSGAMGGAWPAEQAARELLDGAADGEPLRAVPLSPGPGELWLLVDHPESAISWSEMERLGRALGTAVERHRVSERGHVEREELRRRVEESEALHVLGLAANRTLDPDEVLTLVARSSRTLLGANYVTVSTSLGSELRLAAAIGLRAQHPDGDPLAERVIAAGKPVVVGSGESPIEDLPLHVAEGMQTGLGVPLSLFGEIFGALVVGYRRQYPLQPRDTRLALTLAGHAAVAISNARLHRAIADRSGELERANEELRWSATAKERFFAAISHELRTPLHSIVGYQSLLLEGIVGELTEGARGFLGNAQRAANGLLVLLNDLLDLSKLDAGKMEVVPRVVEPRSVLTEAVATVRPLAEQKGLEMRVSAEEVTDSFATDPDRLRQILVNLLSNAIKFTERGHVAVDLRVQPGSAFEGRALVIRVEDTGPGIPSDSHERIFHEFEQIAGPAAVAGTGLGLTISRKLARRLGGDLVVDGEYAGGAAFVLRLPEVRVG